MALAVAGLAAEGRTEVDTAEAVSVTFPTSRADEGTGANIETSGLRANSMRKPGIQEGFPFVSSWFPYVSKSRSKREASC